MDKAMCEACARRGGAVGVRGGNESPLPPPPFFSFFPTSFTLKYWKIWRARASKGMAPGTAGPGTSYTLRTRLAFGARLTWDQRPEEKGEKKV